MHKFWVFLFAVFSLLTLVHAEEKGKSQEPVTAVRTSLGKFLLIKRIDGVNVALKLTRPYSKSPSGGRFFEFLV